MATWAVDRAMSPAAAVASGDRAKSPVVVVVVGCWWPTDALEVGDGGEAEMSETGICH